MRRLDGPTSVPRGPLLSCPARISPLLSGYTRSRSPFCQAGMRSEMRSGSSPSHYGFCADESNIDRVLNSSYSPRAAASFVFAKTAERAASLKG